MTDGTDDQRIELGPDALRNLVDGPAFREAREDAIRNVLDAVAPLVPPVRAPKVFHHVVTVSRDTPEGRDKYHEFGAINAQPPTHWIHLPRPSQKQLKEWERAVTDGSIEFDELPAPRRTVPVSLDAGTVVTGTVSLAPDVQPPAWMFTIILDALFHGGRTEVDMDDIKRVVQALSGAKKQLTAVRRADEALYSVILECCSTLI